MGGLTNMSNEELEQMIADIEGDIGVLIGAYMNDQLSEEQEWLVSNWFIRKKMDTFNNSLEAKREYFYDKECK